MALFVLLAILLYLFVFSEYKGWPRPDGLINIGPSAKEAFSEYMGWPRPDRLINKGPSTEGGLHYSLRALYLAS